MSEFNKKIRYHTEFKIVKSSIKELNPQFSLCDILVCYHGDNRNRSSIDKTTIEEALYSLYGCPIIGEWFEPVSEEVEGDWGRHGGRLIWDDSGIRYEETTKPYGFVTEEAYKNASWVEILEKDGHTKKEYLKLTGCILWTSRYEEANSLLDKNYGQSMEIEILSGDYRDDYYYQIDKFLFSGLCILGTEHEPCFESANVGRHYSLDSFKQEFTLMLDEYKKYQNNQKKEDGDNHMEFSQTIIDKVKSVLSETTFRSNCDKHYNKYIPLNVTETEVSFIDREDTYKAYSAPYIVTTPKENEIAVTIDYENKTEKSFVIADKTESELFSVQNEVDTVSKDRVSFSIANHESTVVKDLQDKLSLQVQKYALLESENKTQKDQIVVFMKEKTELQKKNHIDSIDSTVNTYANVMEKCGDFDEYRARLDYSKSKETVEQELKIIYANYCLANQKKSAKFSFAGVTAGIVGDENLHNDPMRERYGDAFDKF